MAFCSANTGRHRINLFRLDTLKRIRKKQQIHNA